MTDIKATTNAAEIDSYYYIHRVYELSKLKNIVTQRDLVSERGQILITKNRALSEISEKIIHTTFGNSMTNAFVFQDDENINLDTICYDIKALISSRGIVSTLIHVLPNSYMILDIFTKLSIEDVMLFKLTLMKDSIPDLYHHSLSVAITAVYLGIQNNESIDNLIKLALAGLFHDIGHLYINPALDNPEYRATKRDKLDIRKHPMIASLILKSIFHYHTDVSNAIRDHHERLDGSGYPGGLSDKRIDHLGHILAVSERAISYIRNIDISKEVFYLETALKFNDNQYGQNLVGCLVETFQRNNKKYTNQTSSESQNILFQKFDILASLFSEWHKFIKPLTDDIPLDSIESPVGFMYQLITKLENNLHRVGVNPMKPQSYPKSVIQDEQGYYEVDAIVSEALYQVQNIQDEFMFRWPEFNQSESSTSQLSDNILEWIRHGEELSYGSWGQS